MRDQADTLRKLMQSRGQSDGRDLESVPSIPVIPVASGKGGVGKSCFVANLGAMLARQGVRVLLVDADFGLANLEILMGVKAQVSLEQVLDGKATMAEAVLGIEPNLWLLPSSTGFMQARKWDSETKSRLIAMLEKCPWEMDLILVDCGAGIQENVISMHTPSYFSTVVLTPEPTSLADAYGLIKVLRNESRISRARVIVNQVTDGRQGQMTFQKLKEIADRFLDVQLVYLGHWQKDEKISQAVMKRKILLDLDAGASSPSKTASPAISCLELIAKRIRQECLGDGEGADLKSARLLTMGRFRDEPARIAPGNTARFWRTLLGEVKA